MSHLFVKKRQFGFTMIEPLVVTTIIILITAIGLVSYTSVNRNARNAKRKADLETVRQSLVLYRTDNGSYPIGTAFNTMMGTISDYNSATTVVDPKNDDIYVYSYSSDGVNFTLTGYLEPDGTIYAISNP